VLPWRPRLDVVRNLNENHRLELMSASVQGIRSGSERLIPERSLGLLAPGPVGGSPNPSAAVAWDRGFR
jgi:hypothetical protein